MGLPDKYFDGQRNVSSTNRDAKPDLAALLNGIYVPSWQSGIAVAADAATLPAAGPVHAVVATAGGSPGAKSLVNAAPAAGEVQVVYDAAGVPTLNFAGADAVTAADVSQSALPAIPV